MNKELMNNELVRGFLDACQRLDPEIQMLLLSEEGLKLLELASQQPEMQQRGKREWTDKEIDDVIARARRGEKVVL